MSRITIILWLILFTIMDCYGQAIYNINNNNGLSSNHVYCTLVDMYGYLWIGTPQGLYQYNGYTLRRYGYGEGLPEPDIWALQEDSKGRIWPLSISHNTGYIKNNKYHRLTKNTVDMLPEVYTVDLKEVGNNIVFMNLTGSGNNIMELGIINNDTLMSKKIIMSNSSNAKSTSLYYIIGDKLVRVLDSFIYACSLDSILKSTKIELECRTIAVKANYNILNELYNEQYCKTFADVYYVYYKPLGKRLNFLDIYKGTVQRVYIDSATGMQSESILFCYVANRKFYCLTDKHIFSLNHQLQVSQIFRPDKIFENSTLNGYNNTYYAENTLWGKILCTKNTGLFIKYTEHNNFVKQEIDLGNYYYLNNATDSTGYWWNDQEKVLSVVDGSKMIYSQKIGKIFKARKVVRYDSTRSILINQSKTLWLYDNGHFDVLADHYDSTIMKDNYTMKRDVQGSLFSYIADLAVEDTANIYALGPSLYGSYKFYLDNKSKSIVIENFDHRRYRYVIVNKKHHLLICYSTDKVFVRNTLTGNLFYIDQKRLEALGIFGIEKIFVDDYGNVIVKDYNSIHVLNIISGYYKKLFSNYVLTQCIVDHQENRLSIAGGFGILQCTLGNNVAVTGVKMFPNTKRLLYRFVYDAQFASKYILLKTDNGVYRVNTQIHNDTSNVQYSIIINNDGKLKKLLDGDTIVAEQRTAYLDIDIIRPAGTGSLNINYSFSGRVFKNSGNQLILPKLSPGEYTTVSMVASDASWRSAPVRFYIYTEPYWWQTSIAKKIIFVFAFLSVIGMVYLIIILTRRIVNRTNDRRNQRRELELKSIYSQINPHFIFNTLSTALYFVKKNKTREAYEHINQFSDLLRAYIKSSRNKYITIADEIENLENYFQLQLSRFEEKFEYDIEVDGTINPSIVRLPSLLLQPLVENALNHGIFHKETKGYVKVSFAINPEDTTELVCIVDDNGIGRKRSKEIRSDLIKKADSYGTILIEELIETFNKYEKINIELEYIDKKEPETGTIAIVRIKNYHYAQ